MNRLIILLSAVCLAASAETVAIVNARIVPVSSPTIDKATLIIRDGKISAVGQKVAIPAGARRIDATGLSVYPGWIDGWTRVGLSEVAGVAATVDTTELGPFNPAAQAWIAVNPHSEMVKTARVNGVTSALVAPMGGRISGVASAMNLFGMYPDQMALLKNAGLVLNLPGSSTSGRGGDGPAPAAGPGDAGDARRRRIAEDTEKMKQFLREAKRYSEMRARSGANPPPGSIDDGFEAMLPVIRGERPVIIPANSYKDIKTAVDLASEFSLKLLIAGGADAWKLAPTLAKNNVGVLYGALHELPRSVEDPYDIGFAAPEILRRAGVRFAIVSDSAADVRNLPYRASMAAAYGLEREDALKSITLWPAQILGIADKVGSLETGKLANLFISKGDPFDVRAEIRHVFIEGREVPVTNRNLQMFEEFRGTPTGH